MHNMILWFCAACGLFLLEAATLGLTSIWFAFGAIVAGILAAVGCSFFLQVVSFLVVSVICLLFTRPLAKRHLNSRTEKTNAESLLGCTGVVTEDIDNLLAKGQVLVKGQYWTARTENDSMLIAEGAKVIVKKISGVTLIVYPSAIH